MATLSQMASSSSPSVYAKKFVGTVALAGILSGVLLHLSPAPAAAPLVEPLRPEAVPKGPGLMRREQPTLHKAAPAPRPEAWGHLMRREAPVLLPLKTGQSPLVILMAALVVVVAHSAMNGQGTLIHMARSSSPAAYLPKFLGLVVMAGIMTALLLHVSSTSQAPEQLMRREAPQELPKESPIEQRSTLLWVASFAAWVWVAFIMRGKGTLSQMARSSSPSAYVPKFLATIVVAGILSGALLHFSPSPAAGVQLMRSTAPAHGNEAPQMSSRLFLGALCGMVALGGFAIQAKAAFMQLMSNADVQKYFNIKADK